MAQQPSLDFLPPERQPCASRWPFHAWVEPRRRSHVCIMRLIELFVQVAELAGAPAE